MPKNTENKSTLSPAPGNTSQRLLFDFIRKSPFPYLIIDESGTIVATSFALNKLLRYAVPDIGQLPLTNIIAPDSKKIYFESFRNFCGNDCSYELPITFVRQDGVFIRVRLLRHTSLISETGAKHVVIGVHDCMEDAQIDERVAQIEGHIARQTQERIHLLEQEIEERKQMETAFQESQERQSLAFWGARMAWWEYDLTTDYIATSPRINELLGEHYLIQQMTREDFFRHIHPDDVLAMRKAYDAHISGHAPIINLQLRLLMENNAWKWVSIRGRATEFDVNQQPLRIIGVLQDISDLKQAEEEYALLFKHSPDMLAVLGWDGLFQRVNPAWEKVLGWRPEEMIGKSAISFTHPDDRAIGRQTLDMLSAGNLPPLLEQRALCKDGSYRWLSCLLVPLPDRQISFGIARNITSQKEKDTELHQLNQTLEQRVAERSAALQIALDKYRLIADELRNQKAYLSDAMSLGQIAYWEYDLASNTFALNDAFYELMRTDAAREGGYRIKADIFQKRFLPSHERNSLADCMQNVPNADPNILHSFEIPVRWGDGSSGHAMIHIRLEKDADGNIRRLYGITQNITEQKATKTAAEQQQIMYRSLFDTAPSPIFVADAQTGFLIDANKRALEFTGLEIAAIQAMHFSELHDAETRAKAESMFHKMNETRVLDTVLLNLRHNDGHYKPVVVSGGVFDCGGNTYAIGIMHDINRQKEQMEQLFGSGNIKEAN